MRWAGTTQHRPARQALCVRHHAASADAHASTPPTGSHTRLVCTQVDQGGWQAVVPISSITTGGHKLDVQVDGVVAQVQVHVQESGALLQATKH